MSYVDIYKKLKILFVPWIYKYACDYDIRAHEIVGNFFYYVKKACRLVPQFSHLEEDDVDCYCMYHKFTDEDLDVMLKYFHENPDVWQKYLDES